VPLPSPEGCGPCRSCSMGRSGREGCKGGPREWEAQAVCRKMGLDESRAPFLPFLSFPHHHTTTDRLGSPLHLQHTHTNPAPPPTSESDETPNPGAGTPHDDAGSAQRRETPSTGVRIPCDDTELANARVITPTADVSNTEWGPPPPGRASQRSEPTADVWTCTKSERVHRSHVNPTTTGREPHADVLKAAKVQET